jgi:hypothetical protein
MAVAGIRPDISMSLFRQLHDGTRQQVRNEIKLASFKLKKICEPCNNGWMSKLESAAKPHILGLIIGQLSLETLTEDERRILKKWAGKTAIVESHAVGAECPVDAKYLRWMRTSEFPGRFAAAACKTQFLGFGHLQVGVIRRTC